MAQWFYPTLNKKHRAVTPCFSSFALAFQLRAGFAAEARRRPHVAGGDRGELEGVHQRSQGEDGGLVGWGGESPADRSR